MTGVLWRFLYGCLLICLAGCGKTEKEVIPPIPVTGTLVLPKTIPADFEYVGVGESSHIVELRARVEGYLKQIDYTEGSVVKEDSLMFVIDQRPFIATLDSAKGELASKEAILWNAVETKDRMVPLYKEKAVSKKDLDDALAGEMAARANVKTAQAHVQTATLNLGFTSIRAPVSGLSGRAIFREGALISPGTNSLLANLYVIDPIWVNFSVSEGDLLKARILQQKEILQFPQNDDFQIEVILADNTVVPAEGKIDFTAPSLQQKTGTMLIRATLPNPNQWILPGQFVKVVLKGAKWINAITIPQAAVLQGQAGTYVYVISKKGQAEVRPVETGEWYHNDWIILSGLKKGDIVIADGVNRIENGSKVHLTKILADGSAHEVKKAS